MACHTASPLYKQIKTMNTLSGKIERNLGWVLVLLLLFGCLLVLRPFVSAVLWAVVLCISSWPIYNRLLHFLGNRRTLAAVLMTLAMILIVLLPIFIVVMTLADNLKELTGAVRNWIEGGLPAPPEWLAKIPVVGQKAVEYWRNMSADSAQLWAHAQHLIEPVSAGILKGGLAFGGGLIQLALSIFIAFFLFRDGVSVGRRLTTMVNRIGGERGGHLLTIASKTVRGVVYGILGTALVQAVVAGIGFLIAGVPGAALLALMTFSRPSFPWSAPP